jgi:peptidoglycan/LPS O-acetylase OafA/YrhL
MSGTATPPVVRHRHEIDGLRAIAVLAVIAHHAAPRFLPGGFVGVDVFFVISGYLITFIILRDLDAGTFSFAAFYERRVRRLLPNLTLLLLFCSCIAWCVLLPSDFRDYSRSLFATGTFTSNMFFWRDSWYFAAPAQTKPLLHTWSLAIEEQYYLLFPGALWILKRYLPGRLRTACVFGFLGSLALSIWAVIYSPAGAFYLLPSRAWELLLGSLLVVGGLPAPRSALMREALAAAGLAAIIAAVLLVNTATAFPGAAALLPCIGTALVIHAGNVPVDTMTRRMLSSRPLVIIGVMSYSLYLWHWPLLAFARYYFLSGITGGMTVLFTGLSALAAYLAWRFVEQPVRLRTILATRRRLTIAFAACSAVVLVFAVAGDRSDGWTRRFQNVPLIDYDSLVADIGRDPTGTCFLPARGRAEWNEAACTFASAGRTDPAPRRLFLIGDSFAAQFSGWLVANFPGKVVELTAASCPPLFDYVSDIRPRWCTAINDIRERTLHSGHFTDVFLAAWWGQTQNRATTRALETTVHRILDSGVAHLTVLGTAPTFQDSPVDIVNRARAFGRPAAAVLRTDTYPQYRAVLERIARLPRVTVINVDDWVCRDSLCPYMLDSDLLFVDGAAHLTRTGVRYVMSRADWIDAARTAPSALAR